MLLIYSRSFTNDTLPSVIQRKNAMYGAMNPAVTNVIFTHGHLDPWRMMGIQKDLNRNAQAIVIPGTLIPVPLCLLFLLLENFYQRFVICLEYLFAFLTGASHCNDLRPIDFERDTRDMLYAKIAIRNAVRTWLKTDDY